MDIPNWSSWSCFFKKFAFSQSLVQHYLRTTVVWRIAALWRVLGLLAWNGSSWLSPGAAVRKSDSKVSKGLWVLCLVCFNWFVFLLGLSQHTTRFCKVVYFNFQNFLVDRKHNQQTWSHFSSGKQDAKFRTLSCVNCGTTPEQSDSLYRKNIFIAHFSFEGVIFNSTQFWDSISKLQNEMETPTFPLKTEI